MPPHLTDPRQAAQPGGYNFRIGVGLRCFGALLYSSVLLPVAWSVQPAFFESFDGMPLASELVQTCPAMWESRGFDAATGALNPCFLLHALAVFHVVLSCLCCSMMATASTFHMVWRGVTEGAQYFLQPRDEYVDSLLIVDEGSASAAAATPQSCGGRVFAVAPGSSTQGVRGAASLLEKGEGAAGFDLEDVGRGLQSRYHLPLPTRTTSPLGQG